MATAPTMQEVTFQTGPYGEIFPLPLLAGMTAEEALEQLVKDSAEMGHPFDPPSRGQYVEEMAFRGECHVHQQRLPKAMSGEMADVPEATALRRAVMDLGHKMSLRPFGMEILEYASFAPVLQYLGDDRWQVGLEEHGRVKTFETDDPAKAVKAAQRVFKTWADEDDDGWMDMAEKAMEEYPRSLFHSYWARQIRKNRVWDRGGGFVLHLQDNHYRFRLELPDGGVRLFKTTGTRGVHITDAVARRAGVEPRFPYSPMVKVWLREEEGIAVPEHKSPFTEPLTRWDIGDVKVKMLPEKQQFVLEDAEGNHYVIRIEGKKRPEFVMRQVKDGKPDDSRVLAHTAIEAPFKQWLSDVGRTTIPTWFVYEAKLGGRVQEEG